MILSNLCHKWVVTPEGRADAGGHCEFGDAGVSTDAAARQFFAAAVGRRTCDNCGDHPDRLRLGRSQHDFTFVSAWIVLYAGLIFLGFGGCRWTSDMAINYYRTVLGIGVSLMTMKLIVAIGVRYLHDLVASTSTTLDAAQLGIIMVAAIILAVISHRLPHIVAGMVVGGGHNGAIGGVGVMTLFAASMTGAGLVGRMSGNPAAMLAT
jgi:type IV secretory pathway TrbL component